MLVTDSDTWITAAEVAVLIGMSERMARHLGTKGQILAVPIRECGLGRVQRLYSQRSAEQWLARRRGEAVQP